MKAKKSEFLKTRQKVGLGQAEKAAEFLCCSIEEIEQWDKTNAPKMAIKLLLYWDKWDCTAHGQDWKGFKFSRGRLVNARERLIFSPERLKTWPSTCNQLAKLEIETNKKGKLNQLLKAIANWPRTMKRFFSLV